MAYRSRIDELAAMRARGQRPEIMVVTGDSAAAAWASRNRFYFVPERELGDDTTPFSGLYVLVRSANPLRLQEQIQRLALAASLVMIFNTASGHVEYLAT